MNDRSVSGCSLVDGGYYLRQLVQHMEVCGLVDKGRFPLRRSAPSEMKIVKLIAKEDFSEKSLFRNLFLSKSNCQIEKEL